MVLSKVDIEFLWTDVREVSPAFIEVLVLLKGLISRRFIFEADLSFK